MTYPWRGKKGYGTGCPNLEDHLGWDGALTGEIDAKPSDLIAMTRHTREPLDQNYDLYIKAEGERANLAFSGYKPSLGWLSGSAWVSSVQFTFDDDDDVFQFGYIGGRSITDCFKHLDSVRDGGAPLFDDAKHALAAIKR
jgi:hypothetical protein